MAHTRFDDAFAPIAVATRNGLDESLHFGAAVVLDANGDRSASVGDPHVVVYPRSSLKPLQADAMVSLGLRLPAELLALACASHSGESMHLSGVQKILSTHDLTEADLNNTPARPYSAAARTAARNAGIEPSSLQQNCSGKHAAMLATCRVNGWPIEGYVDIAHPLQVAITDKIAVLIGHDKAGEETQIADASGAVTKVVGVDHVGVDGCGAPTHAFALIGLARAFLRLAQSDVAHAMSSAPEMVGGTGRDVSTWMRAVPNLIAKEGAAGVMAAARPDGGAVAFKIADGSDAARQAVTVEALRQLGVDTTTSGWERTTEEVAVQVLGHGRNVGQLRALGWAG